MKRVEYREGVEARKSFEETMKNLFRVPKSEIKPKPKRTPAQKGDSAK